LSQVREHTILVASKDPRLADVRKRVLEAAGFSVIPAPDVNAVREACEKLQISLVMIGYSLQPSEKRRIWNAAREFCQTPILELYRHDKPDITDSRGHLSHRAQAPDDFLQAVHKALTSN